MESRTTATGAIGFLMVTQRDVTVRAFGVAARLS